MNYNKQQLECVIIAALSQVMDDYDRALAVATTVAALAQSPDSILSGILKELAD